MYKRQALVKSMKRKFNIKMNTACYETECKFKQAMDDVEQKDLQDPYAYLSWTRNVMRKRKSMKFTGRLKNIVKSGTSTERRFQALEVRSVSYTHLDVYKRQPHSNIMN